MSLRLAPITIALIVINVIVFGLDQLSPVVDSSDIHTLMYLGAIVPQLVSAGEYYRIVTSGFLQFNFQHIAFNMYALTQAGMVVENLYGSARFAVIYAVALLAGGVLAYVTSMHSQAITAGASGAIMGLFGAMAALGFKTPRIGRTLVSWAAFPIIATLAVGFTTPGISNAGHIGGVIGGAVTAFVLRPVRMRVPAPDEEDVV